MTFRKLKCPCCDANLVVENGLDICYCQYCGTRIIIEGMDSHIVEARTKIEIEKSKNQLKKDKRQMFYNYLGKRKEEETKRSIFEMKFLGYLLAFSILYFLILTILESCGISL